MTIAKSAQADLNGPQLAGRARPAHRRSHQPPCRQGRRRNFYRTHTAGLRAPPAGRQPAGRRPAGRQPAGRQPAGRQPAGRQPAGRQPAGRQRRWPPRSATPAPTRSGTRCSRGTWLVSGREIGLPVRYHLDNPVYAVRYAHAHAASTLRQAADLGLARGRRRSSRRACSPTQPSGRCSMPCPGCPNGWRGRRAADGRASSPGTWSELAGTYQDCREGCPALPFGGRSAPRDQPAVGARLWLVTATAAAIAAGLALLGVSAPARL